ncbi:MAG: DUF1232 domain-containing protein [Bacteroidales bacterium]|jgi:uncharacterized membrane protein YkvA (DUF1232 family)|nr:DUF1232 domain-containing protein [Bacteroidota bacterium]MCF8348255.1 DUF1232 domain-containing protein [Bacteroidales bacterium]
MKFYPRKYKEYIGHFEEKALFEKIKHVAGMAGSTLIYYALILYILLADKGIPAKSKLIIVAALGYFILPADLIADILPGLGFTDDIAFLTYAISTVSEYMTPEVKEKAMERLNSKNTGSTAENRL